MQMSEAFDRIGWEYARGGYDAVRTSSAADARAWFYLAVLAFGHDDFARAAECTRRAAAEEPASALYREASAYLDRVARDGKQAVYVTGEAFGAFIRGGGNLPLYRETSAALRRVYDEYGDLRLLDIGVGDGLALLAALNERVHSITLVEPSAAMLSATARALAERGVAADAVNGTLQEFVREERGRWDVAEATFSLQSIAPDERPALLRWLRAHAGRVLIAEFDPPAYTTMYAPQWVSHVMQRYEIGLAEYADDGGLVAQGFLMPVFFGYFDRSAARTNYENPIDDWVQALRDAGFVDVEKRRIFDYWWATAWLVDGRSDSR
jgi:ubiquinone/menaquinone biosynthesis C-methylase UbiE